MHVVYLLPVDRRQSSTVWLPVQLPGGGGVAGGGQRQRGGDWLRCALSHQRQSNGQLHLARVRRQTLPRQVNQPVKYHNSLTLTGVYFVRN